MDSPFLTLVFVGLGFFLSRFAPLVQSRENVNPGSESSPSPPPPPPQPPSPSSLSSPSPYSPTLSPRRPQGPARSLPPRNRRAKTSPPPKENLNLGKKIGLVFAGIVGMMQIGVVAFLVIKRHQLLKNNDRL